MTGGRVLSLQESAQEDAYLAYIFICVAYCRSAREPQSGPSSVGGQAAAIRRYARRKGLTVRATYIDPGVSGMSS